MPHKQIQKLLFYFVRFLKKTSYHHKKKLITLAVIALLSYVAKKKLRLVHLLQLAQKITKIISYLPLPTFPEYRKLNRYESVKLHPLIKEIISAMQVQEIKAKIKQRKSDWNELKSSVFSGVILSLTLYNIQSLYFIIQNKYQLDFRQLNSLETFERMMGDIRKKFVSQISGIKQMLGKLLEEEISKIDIRTQYSLDDYFAMVERMVGKVFEGKYQVRNKGDQLLENNFYRNDAKFQIAKNLFMTPLQYIPPTKSTLRAITSSISKFASRFTFTLFKQPVCELTAERFEWVKLAYQIPLKKTPTDTLLWPNRQSELLSKLVLKQIDQMLGSVNFSTVLYENAQYNLNVLKNRLFLYFGKNNLTNLRTAESLIVFYKLIKEEILVGSGLNAGEEDKRERFYEGEILKAIRHKNLSESKAVSAQGPELLIRQEKKQLQNNQGELSLSLIKREDNQQIKQNDQQEIVDENQNPELILLNMHLQEIYESRQLGHLVKEFQVKYFNERSGVMLSPMKKTGKQQNKAGTDEDDIKKLLNMLGDNEELNRKEE